MLHHCHFCHSETEGLSSTHPSPTKPPHPPPTHVPTCAACSLNPKAVGDTMSTSLVL
jgi:hypothetical protein